MSKRTCSSPQYWSDYAAQARVEVWIEHLCDDAEWRLDQRTVPTPVVRRATARTHTEEQQ